jgi:hypothetical protein
MRQGQDGGLQRLAMAGEVLKDHPQREEEAESGERGEMLGGRGSGRANRRGLN